MPALQDQEDGERGMRSNWEFVRSISASPRMKARTTTTKRAGVTGRIPARTPTIVRLQRGRAGAAQSAGLEPRPAGQGGCSAAGCWSASPTSQPRRPESGVRCSCAISRTSQWAPAAADKQRAWPRSTPDGTPFLLVAESGGRRAYLKLNNGAALPVSHFDVGGETVQQGTEGRHLRRARRVAAG